MPAWPQMEAFRLKCSRDPHKTGSRRQLPEIERCGYDGDRLPRGELPRSGTHLSEVRAVLAIKSPMRTVVHSCRTDPRIYGPALKPFLLIRSNGRRAGHWSHLRLFQPLVRQRPWELPPRPANFMCDKGLCET